MDPRYNQRIGRLTPSDLTALARVYRAAFPASALTVLGAGSVRRYYEWLMTGPHNAVYLGLWADDILSGFCICGRFRGALTGFVRRNAGYLTMQMLLHPSLWIRPKVRRGVRLALRLIGLRRKRRGNAPKPSRGEPSFGVLALGVLPEKQGRGIGRRLMEEATHVARARGFRRMHLTVAASNERAIRLYSSQGWRIENRENENLYMTRTLGAEEAPRPGAEGNECGARS